MDADTILRIRPMLTAYLHEFDGCMGRVTNRPHLETYVSGQLGDLDRSAHLSKYPDCELVLIITATGKAEEQTMCRIRGFAMNIWERTSGRKHALHYVIIATIPGFLVGIAISCALRLFVKRLLS